MKGIIYTCNGPRMYRLGEKVALVRGGIPNEAGAEYLGHRGCGHNLTTAIYATPADGKTYKVKCPKCGTIGEHMKTPPDQPSPEAP